MLSSQRARFIQKSHYLVFYVLFLSLLSTSLFAHNDLEGNLSPQTTEKINNGSIKYEKLASYEEWEALLRLKVSMIPDLSYLWGRRTWNQSQNYINQETDFFLAGGALRSLILWLDQQLSTQSLSTVYMMTPPAMDELILVGADKDIFLKGITKEEFKKDYPEYDKWDLLSDSFQQQSLEAGGSEIEKVGANPEALHDPLGALRKYYKGRIEFLNSPEATFSQFRYSDNAQGLNSNSKLALILRHLRFLLMFNIKFDKDELKAMRSIVETEIPNIQSKNYWISKSLRKIQEEYLHQGGSLEKLAQLLLEIGAFTPLVVNDYLFKDNQSLLKYISVEQLPYDSKFIDLVKERSKSTDNIISLIDLYAHDVKTAQDFIRLFDPEMPEISEYYAAQLDEKWLQYAQKFAHLKPTPQQITFAFKYARSYLSRSELLNEIGSISPQLIWSQEFDPEFHFYKLRWNAFLKNFDKFLQLELKTDDFLDLPHDALSYVVNENANLFFKTQPNIEQFKKALLKIDDISVSSKLIKEALEYYDLEFWNIIFQTSLEVQDRQHIDNIATESIDIFISKNPDIPVFKNYVTYINKISKQIELRRKILKSKRWSPEEQTEFLKPQLNNPHPGFLAALHQLKNEIYIFEVVGSNFTCQQILY